jgi:hypothetical protein
VCVREEPKDLGRLQVFPDEGLAPWLASLFGSASQAPDRKG